MLVLLAAAGAATAGAAARAEEDVPPQVEVAVARGLASLARQQQPDGAFTAPEDAGGAARDSTAAQAVLAYLAAGHVPGEGRHGLVVRDALDFLLRRVPEDGYAARLDGSGMFGQAMITLALAESHGVEHDAARRRAVRAALQRCVAALVRLQETRDVPMSGGWGAGWAPEQRRGAADLVTTFWVVRALRSAVDAGAAVGPAVFSRAAAFVLSCHGAAEHGFADHTAGAASPLTNAAAAGCLLLLKSPARGELADALKLLSEHRVSEDLPDPYGAGLLLTQVASLAGDSPTANAVRPVRESLLARQTENGWPPVRVAGGPTAAGYVTSTATACLTLATPYRMSPMNRR